MNDETQEAESPEPLHVGRPNVGSREVFLDYVADMFESKWLSNNGPLAQKFERELANHLGVKHCVVVANGTIGLEIAIKALGLKGEVIVPSYTFVATAHALQWLGLTPVFADIDPDTHCIDPRSVREKITPLTTAIIGVHLWGRIAATSELQEIANQYGLHLLYDAAHAFSVGNAMGMVGSFGEAEVFSFHATKFFNSFEGGAVTTNDDELANRLRLMRNFGFAGEDNVVCEGTNGKMTEVCAAMGLTNLMSLESVVDVNRRNYLSYCAELGDVKGVNIMRHDEKSKSNFQYIVLEVDEGSACSRDDIYKALTARNIFARKYFWPGIHMMEPYRSLDSTSAVGLPNTTRVASRVLVLPTGVAVSGKDISRIAEIVRETVELASGS